MKLQADRAEGVNVIHAHTVNTVSVSGHIYAHSVLVPPTGEPAPWPPATLDELSAEHFEQIARLQPELVLLGTGPRLRFASPALMRSLIEMGVGVETMDTAAACRTFNFLVGEGRRVVCALLVHD